MSAHTIQKIHILSSYRNASSLWTSRTFLKTSSPAIYRIRRRCAAERLGAAVGDINTPPPSSSPSMDRWDDDENAYPSRPLPPPRQRLLHSQKRRQREQEERSERLKAAAAARTGSKEEKKKTKDKNKQQRQQQKQQEKGSAAGLSTLLRKRSRQVVREVASPIAALDAAGKAPLGCLLLVTGDVTPADDELNEMRNNDDTEDAGDHDDNDAGEKYDVGGEQEEGD